VVKQKLKPPVTAKTTTVDPEAGDDFAEHNMFGNMPKMYKILTAL
jgi:hypothetical protein